MSHMFFREPIKVLIIFFVIVNELYPNLVGGSYSNIIRIYHEIIYLY